MTSERHDIAVERTKGMAEKVVLCVIPASTLINLWDCMHMQSTVQFCLYYFAVQNPVNARTAQSEYTDFQSMVCTCSQWCALHLSSAHVCRAVQLI